MEFYTEVKVVDALRKAARDAQLSEIRQKNAECHAILTIDQIGSQEFGKASSIAVGSSSLHRIVFGERTPGTTRRCLSAEAGFAGGIGFFARARTWTRTTRAAMAEAPAPAPKDAPRKSTEFRTVGEAMRFIFTLDFIKLALIGEDRWCAAVVTAIASVCPLLTA